MWTPIAKPTASTYGYVNPQGKEFYDQSNITYDDPNVFYDGIDPNQWSDINKPVSSTWTMISKPI